MPLKEIQVPLSPQCEAGTKDRNWKTHDKCREFRFCDCACHFGRTYLMAPMFDHGKNYFFRATEEEPSITVYRLENERGEGPFRKTLHEFQSDKSWIVQDRRRTIWYLGATEDFSYNLLMKVGFFEMQRAWNGEPRGNGLLFGFTDREQIRQWFVEEEIENLKRVGFELRERQASLVLASDIQCIFKPVSDRIPNTDPNLPLP